jgi:hypothetical protein
MRVGRVSARQHLHARRRRIPGSVWRVHPRAHLAPVHVGGHGRHGRAALPATHSRGILNTDTNAVAAVAESHADALGVAIALGVGIAIALGVGIAFRRSDGYADANPICFTAFVHDAATLHDRHAISQFGSLKEEDARRLKALERRRLD